MSEHDRINADFAARKANRRPTFEAERDAIRAMHLRSQDRTLEFVGGMLVAWEKIDVR